MNLFQNSALVVGMATGISGLILGIANYRHRINYSSSQLRVIPKLGFPGPLDEIVTRTFFNERVERELVQLKTYACIEVKNLGPRTQTILEVGCIDNNGEHLPWRDPDSIEPVQEFPIVVPPNETVLVSIRFWLRDTSQIHGVAYVKTDCNEEFNGTSPIITDFLKWQNLKESNAA